MDGRNRIGRQLLVHTIGVLKDKRAVPAGLVIEFPCIPQAFHSLLRQSGLYLLPSLVHDYPYRMRSYTRVQAEHILTLGMIEKKVPGPQRLAINGTVRAAGGFAWDANAKDRAAKLIRMLPPDRLDIGPSKLWPDYQREPSKAGVPEAPSAVI